MSQDKKNIGSVIVVCIQFSKLVSKIEQVGDCMEKKENGTALLPIVVFLVIYLGNGVYFEYVRPVDGEMGFYIMSVVVAFVIALIVALLQNRTVSFDEKIKICAKGIGDEKYYNYAFYFPCGRCF